MGDGGGVSPAGISARVLFSSESVTGQSVSSPKAAQKRAHYKTLARGRQCLLIRGSVLTALSRLAVSRKRSAAKSQCGAPRLCEVITAVVLHSFGMVRRTRQEPRPTLHKTVLGFQSAPRSPGLAVGLLPQPLSTRPNFRASAGVYFLLSVSFPAAGRPSQPRLERGRSARHFWRRQQSPKPAPMTR